MCEVFYDAFRSGGQTAADQVVNTLILHGVAIREDMDRAFWSDLDRIKVSAGSLSLADCAATALARHLTCELVTTDHHEMDKLVGIGVAALKFIR